MVFNILIVDDDPHVHKLLSKMLPRERYSIRSALSAPEAIEALLEEAPHLVMLDIMMPEMSGLEVLDRVRKEKSLADTLILVLSAKDAQSDRLEGLEHGADEYVSKPFHVQHLIRKIEHMLAKRYSPTT